MGIFHKLRHSGNHGQLASTRGDTSSLLPQGVAGPMLPHQAGYADGEREAHRSRAMGALGGDGALRMNTGTNSPGTFGADPRIASHTMGEDYQGASSQAANHVRSQPNYVQQDVNSWANEHLMGGGPSGLNPVTAAHIEHALYGQK